MKKTNKIANDPILPFVFAKENNILLINNILEYVSLPNISILSEIHRKYNNLVFKQTSEAELIKKIQKFYENSSINNLDNYDNYDELTEIAEDINKPVELLDDDDDAPIIRLLNAIFAEAILKEASDIHIEIYENKMRVRLRINGSLITILEPNQKVAPLIVSRVKVMAKLDIAEKRLPQDGRIAITLGTRAVDMRISTIPAAAGEKVVLRLLDKQVGRLQLQQLGMNDDCYNKMVTLLNKPHGIILVTGPTGSGKTTTLYAALSILNDSERNIMTVEDPIEYHIYGINQTQINAKINMTFAKGLRAILRQDPDIIMVGEIRDSETAQIAIQASLTGHLVFSTLHTNSAIGAITRLKDMGVESFLLSSSINAVLAQRLLRRLCDDCKISSTTDASQMLRLAIKVKSVIYKACGCKKCNYSGYSGRIGLYELVVLDDNAREIIHNSANENDITNYFTDKYISLRQQAKELVLSGKTSLDEAIRLVLNQ